jgi:hypothetical protein
LFFSSTTGICKVFSRLATDGQPPEITLARGAATALLAEGEQDLRKLTIEFLETGGYRVMVTANGAAKIARSQENIGGEDSCVVYRRSTSGNEWNRIVNPD